jgi:hypothetical protein
VEPPGIKDGKDSKDDKDDKDGKDQKDGDGATLPTQGVALG